MIYMWSEAIPVFCKQYKYGQRVHGLRQNYIRPDTLYIFDWEFDTVDPEYTRKLLYKAYIPALRNSTGLIIQDLDYNLSEYE